LEILGFPSNDFKQEPGSARQIIELARKKYGAEFPIFEEAPVNGKDT
jgi:glutathione peroxidase